MATFRTYAEVLRPDQPLMKNKARSTSWSPSRYRSAEIEQAMRAEPGVVLGDVLRQTGGAYETTTRLTPKFREDIHDVAEQTSDDELLGIAELPEAPVSLEHLAPPGDSTRARRVGRGSQPACRRRMSAGWSGPSLIRLRPEAFGLLWPYRRQRASGSEVVPSRGGFRR
jgi:hypothetical protein